MKRLAACLVALVTAAFWSSCAAAAPASVREGTMKLSYAEQFSVEMQDDGTSRISVGDDHFLLVPEGVPVPDGAQDTVLQQPLTDLYVAASSAMDLFDTIDSLDAVRMTSTKYEDWGLPSVRAAMDTGELTYIGKYSAPDYEALLETGCTLAVESTMIYHSPEVKEQIEALGIPVLVERSSYEHSPMARMEWIRLYGLLLGCEERADAYFASQVEKLTQLGNPSTGRTVAFFYIHSSGSVVVRKPGDYVSEMIVMAGGENLFTAEDLHAEENALSTVNIQMEAFYEKAVDADVLIYNSSIEGGYQSLDALLREYPLLADCRAVQTGDVWCTHQNMFQKTTGAADMIGELHSIFDGSAPAQMTYFYQLVKEE